MSSLQEAAKKVQDARAAVAEILAKLDEVLANIAPESPVTEAPKEAEAPTEHFSGDHSA